MNDPLLNIEDLSVQYNAAEGKITAVSNASITIDEGEYMGIVGESGCGKSTIAKSILGGLENNGTVESGKIEYRGEEIQDLSEDELNERIRWKEISWIPQGSMNSLDPLKKIKQQAWDIANTHTEMEKEEALEQFRDMFEIVGLQEERIDDYPHQLSGGMQQRVIIALALFLNPSMIIADEPTTALDVIMQDQIMKYTDRIKQETDTSMMLITHDISLVLETCDTMLIMHSGQVAETGHITELYDRPKHPYSIMLQRAFPDVRHPDRELEIIEGHPPQMEENVDYCTFTERCPLATEECHQRAPELVDVGDGSTAHKAACYHTDKSHELRRNGGSGGNEHGA